MSAGASMPAVDRDPGKLAPAFRFAVEKAVSACVVKHGLDVYVYEAYRSQELQEIYYARGRTVKPPYQPVTNARSNLHSWHGFGLAVDVISRSKKWDAGADWFAAVAAVFKKHGCDWGGDWRQVDLPHMQWGTLRASPSERARELLRTGGFEAVWKEVGAHNIVTPIVVPTRVLSLGIVGEDVRALQKALGAPITGIFDELTDAWVRGFQRGFGLTVDGDVGPVTREALGLGR